MAEVNYAVRGGSRAKDHGSWRAGHHWPSGGDKEVIVTRGQLAELKADPNITLLIVGSTAKPASRRDDHVNGLREVSQAAPDVDLSFLDGIASIDDPAKVSSPVYDVPDGVIEALEERVRAAEAAVAAANARAEAAEAAAKERAPMPDVSTMLTPLGDVVSSVATDDVAKADEKPVPAKRR